MQIFISRGCCSIDSTCPYPVSGARPFPWKMSGIHRLDIWICCACRGAVEEENSSLWGPERIPLLISHAQDLGPKLLSTPLCALTKTPRLKHLGNRSGFRSVFFERMIRLIQDNKPMIQKSKTFGMLSLVWQAPPLLHRPLPLFNPLYLLKGIHPRASGRCLHSVASTGWNAFALSRRTKVQVPK